MHVHNLEQEGIVQGRSCMHGTRTLILFAFLWSRHIDLRKKQRRAQECVFCVYTICPGFFHFFPKIICEDFDFLIVKSEEEGETGSSVEHTKHC